MRPRRTRTSETVVRTRPTPSFRLGVALIVMTGLATLVGWSDPAQALPPDPGAPGAYSVTTGFYDFGDTAFTIPTDSVNNYPTGVEVRAEIDYPSSIAGLGALPVVLIMHGDHVPCYNGSTSYEAWPCTNPADAIPSYRGFHYLTNDLASDGFIAVSISLNGFHYKESTYSTDGGLLARAELAEHHLDLLSSWNVSSSGPFGSTFVGHVDLSHVGLIGHSRGGGAAARLVQYNQSLGSPYGIDAVQLLSPFFDSSALSSMKDIAVNVMQSYCDGNSVNTPGVGYVDQDVPLNGLGPHSVIWVMGGNHFFWDTGRPLPRTPRDCPRSVTTGPRSAAPMPATRSAPPRRRPG